MAIDLSDPRVQRALFHATERRRKRYVRVGLTGVPNFRLVAGDTSTIVSDIVAAGVSNAESVSFVCTIQHEGSLEGNIFTVGGGAEGTGLTVLAGTIRLRVVDAAFTSNKGNASEDIAIPFPGIGIHVYVVSIDVPNQKVFLWIDGVRYIEAGITNTQGAGLDSWAFGVFTNHFTSDASGSPLNGTLNDNMLTVGAALGTLDIYNVLPSTV